MDTTEKYIKMCKAEEIQSRWRPTDGDFFANPDEMSEIYVSRPYDMTMYTDKSKLHWIWLPRQDQLQDIISGNVTIGYMVVGLEEFYDPEKYSEDDFDGKCQNLGKRRRTAYDTMEQWWLGFVMHEKFGKWWNMEKSEWIKVK